jgi:putative hemolysin
MNIIDYHDFESKSRIFRGRVGHWLAETIIRFLAIDRVNQVCDHSSAYKGVEFASRLLDDLDVDYMVGPPERLGFLPEGTFIIVSNHPYGGLDGVILIDLVGRIRPDIRFMVNKILSKFKTLNDNIISVTPTGARKSNVTAESIKGMRETLRLIREGHPVGFFPSGAVSDFRMKDFRIKDRDWQNSILHLIHAAKVPIVPIRFFGANSPFFYFLGLIHWKVRTWRLPYEIFNKKANKVRVGIGDIISVEEQNKFSDYMSLGAYLRKTVYEMPKPTTFISRKLMCEGKPLKSII